jgi:hypothetical protein
MSDKFDRPNTSRGANFSVPEDIEPRDMPRSLFDVRIIQHSRRWKWQVGDHSGVVVLYGWERNRRAARYNGYRALFLLLRASCLSRG